MSPSREVAEAVGAGGETREERRARLREKFRVEDRERAELAAADAESAAQQRADADAVLQADVKAWVDGMARGIGGEMRSLAQDDARVLDAAHAYAAAMETLDARYLKIAMWCHAVRAVCAVFGRELPDLPVLVVPAQHPSVDEARVIVAHVPVRATGYIHAELTDGRTGQRTYAELDGTKLGTDGRALIHRKLGPMA
jgi:hypothetical protein